MDSSSTSSSDDSSYMNDRENLSLYQIFCSVVERYMYENESNHLFRRTVYNLYEKYRQDFQSDRPTLDERRIKRARNIAWSLLNPYTLAFDRERSEKKLLEIKRGLLAV
jgi:hypothetical protein